MPSPDVLMMKNSEFNAFLFAHVGLEINGSELTILSTLARLGKDPWDEASKWARLPHAERVACLSKSIVEMPLCSQALVDAPARASELVLLLPSKGKEKHFNLKSKRQHSFLPSWINTQIILFLIAIAFILGISMLVALTFDSLSLLMFGMSHGK